MKAVIMMMTIGLFLPVIAFSAPKAAQPPPGIGLAKKPDVLTKPDVLGRLKSIQEKQTTAIQNADTAMRKLLAEATSIQIGADQVLSERQLQSLTKRLQAQLVEKEELQLRYDFVSQLIFQIDSKWGSQPLNEFLEQRLLDMAAADLTTASVNKPQLWRFYMYLAIAVREIPERREDLIGFIDGYMDFSSIREPKSPALYMNSRHYTNGALNQAARKTTPEQLSATVEKKLKDLETIGVPALPTATPTESAEAIELRTRAPEKTSN